MGGNLKTVVDNYEFVVFNCDMMAINQELKAPGDSRGLKEERNSRQMREIKGRWKERSKERKKIKFEKRKKKESCKTNAGKSATCIELNMKRKE